MLVLLHKSLHPCLWQVSCLLSFGVIALLLTSLPVKIAVSLLARRAAHYQSRQMCGRLGPDLAGSLGDPQAGSWSGGQEPQTTLGAVPRILHSQESLGNFGSFAHPPQAIEKYRCLACKRVYWSWFWGYPRATVSLTLVSVTSGKQTAHRQPSRFCWQHRGSAVLAPREGWPRGRCSTGLCSSREPSRVPWAGAGQWLPSW